MTGGLLRSSVRGGRLKGVITVYLAVITLVLISVIMVSLESARVAAIKSSTVRYSDIAAEMLFSRYVKPMADRYGIFLLEAGSDTELLSVYENYLKMNVESSRDSDKRFLNCYGIVDSVSLKDKTGISEDSFSPLLEQIRRCQLYALGEEGLKAALSGLGRGELKEAEGLGDELSEELERRGDAAVLEAEATAAQEEGTEDAGEMSEDEGGDPESLSGELVTEEEALEDPRPGIGRWLRSGILYLVMGDNPVSGSEIDVSDCSYRTGKSRVPAIGTDFEDYKGIAGSLKEAGVDSLSQEEISDDDTQNAAEDVLSSKTESLLLNLYILGKFKNLCDEEKTEGPTALSYETEYILFGNESDRENLESTMTCLCAVRTVLNLAFLYSSPSRSAQLTRYIASMAIALLPGAAAVIEFLIMACWAGAEAVVDCATLAEGGKVPVWKSDETWNLSLESLAEIAMSGAGARDHIRSRDKGLDYEQYLSLLIFATARKKKIIRMLQLMEKNIRLESGYENFRISDCISAAEIETNTEIAPYLFRHPSKIRYSYRLVYGY